MRFTFFPAVLMFAIMLPALTGCGGRQKETKPEIQKPAVSAQRLPDTPASNRVETAVPGGIKDQLLSAYDIREGAELHAETIVLDAGQKRLLISGRGQFLCSPTGNCPYWIVRETPTVYEKEVELGVAQTVTMEKGSAGFPDLRVRQHGSAFESEVRLYQFDGSQYRLSKCIDENYLDPNDLDHTLDKPTITEFQCRH